MFGNLLILIDIFIVATGIYLVLIFVKQSKSYILFSSVLMVLAIGYFARLFDLALTRQLFQPLLTFFILIFVVVFQKEIRKFFEWFSLSSRKLAYDRRLSLSENSARNIVDAVFEMAQKKIGAILVFAGDYPLENLLAGGFPLEGRITKPILLSIFDTTSPGHDGAVIIENNRIRRFGVHLPLAEADSYGGFKDAGTRHRATAGITERTDALALVVSEEKGIVSLSLGGQLTQIKDSEALEDQLSAFMTKNFPDSNPWGWNFLLKKNLLFKVASVVLAVVLWILFIYRP